jgi:hypothetical protein
MRRFPVSWVRGEKMTKKKKKKKKKKESRGVVLFAGVLNHCHQIWTRAKCRKVG